MKIKELNMYGFVDKNSSLFKIKNLLYIFISFKNLLRLFICFLISILFIWNSYFLYIMINKLNMNDFGKFYYSTIYFFKDIDIYLESPSTLIPISDSLSKNFWNLNPPHFHFFTLPLGLFSPKGSLFLWGLASLFFLIISLLLIVRELRFKVTPLNFFLIVTGFLGLSATSSLLVTGQLSLILLLPFTLAWLAARHKRWTLSGVYIGFLISIKPFLLIFMPYFFLQRQFKAVAAASLVCVLFFMLGFAFFGFDSYVSWIRVISLIDWPWAAMNGSIQGALARTLSPSPYFTPFADMSHLIVPLWAVSAVLVGLLTIYFSLSDYSSNAVDRSFSLLLLGALLISPLGWIYYFWLAVGPLSCLLHSWAVNNCNCGDTLIIHVYWWRRILLLLAVPGLFYPYNFIGLFQPQPIASLLIGSLYFWSFLFLWSALILDFFISRQNFALFFRKKHGTVINN